MRKLSVFAITITILILTLSFGSAQAIEAGTNELVLRGTLASIGADIPGVDSVTVFTTGLTYGYFINRWLEPAISVDVSKIEGEDPDVSADLLFMVNVPVVHERILPYAGVSGGYFLTQEEGAFSLSLFAGGKFFVVPDAAAIILQVSYASLQFDDDSIPDLDVTALAWGIAIYF